MRRTEIAAACRALLRFSLIWFGTLAIGFPLVVLSLGYKLSDGWSFLASTKKRFFVLICLMPYPFIAIGVADAYFKSWIDRRLGKDRRVRDAPPKNPEI